MLVYTCHCDLGKQESFVFRSAWATKSDQSGGGGKDSMENL